MSETKNWRDEPWQGELLARIYEPPPETAALRNGAAVLDVHGGAWAMMNRTLGETYCQAVASAGFVVIAIDFRDGRQARHPAAVQDIAAAVRWVRAQAPRLAIDPERVALMGSSSGGHLALHTALTDVDVPFVAALWPPVDPLTRYRYAKERIGQPVPDGQRFDAPGLVRSTEAYFGDEATMAEGSISNVLRSGRHQNLPKVWLVHAGEDLNVPRVMIDELVAEYARAGGDLELTEYPGEVHAFGHGDHPGARQFQQDLTNKLIAAFA